MNMTHVNFLFHRPLVSETQTDRQDKFVIYIYIYIDYWITSCDTGIPGSLLHTYILLRIGCKCFVGCGKGRGLPFQQYATHH